MAIRELIQQIAAGWRSYQQTARVDKNNSLYSLVVRQLPAELQATVAAFDTVVAEGSTGQGNITAAPWIGLFDRRLTTSATRGYYVVYLFSVDLATVTLSLAFGTTQFREQFGSTTETFARMRLAAARLQEMFGHIIPANMARGPIDLAADSRQGLHFAYQQASILSYPPYRIAALPEEVQLVSDLRALVRVYTDIVSDPLEPTVERLVEAVAEPNVKVKAIVVRDFAERPNPLPRVSNEQIAQARRYSPQSRKVGDAGERIVKEYEQSRLTSIGRSDLADRVRWHGPEGEFLGWDITSFDDQGNEVFIEVKSSLGKTISNICLTANEWRSAQHVDRRERYYLYIVTNALSAEPQIERMRNPAAYVASRQLGLEPIVFELRLTKPGEPPLTKNDAPNIVRVEGFDMETGGAKQLDLNFLAGQARTIALQVAAKFDLYLAPEALAAIDTMVLDHKEVIERTWVGLEAWKTHVLHIATETASIYQSKGIRSIKTPDDLTATARPVYRVYPYD